MSCSHFKEILRKDILRQWKYSICYPACFENMNSCHCDQRIGEQYDHNTNFTFAYV